MRLKDCLREKLGEGDWPRSFSIVGDIAIISLKDEKLLKYGSEIAECIMTIQKRVKAVWAKVETQGEYRVAKLIHLGGEKRTETIYKEHGMRFKLDVSKVYVNPSLAEEHASIAKRVKGGEIVLDAFSGVGFFSFHMAKNAEVRSFAVDINPYAIKYMIENIELNKKLLKGEIIPIMGDFAKVSDSFKDKYFDLVIMNLPHKSLDYLPIAKRLARREIIVYAVVEDEKVEELSKRLGAVEVKKVLDYAPRKGVWRLVLTA